MYCFKHQETSAVGICSSCGKGICPNCAVDTSHAITCDEKGCIEYADLRYEVTMQAPKAYLAGNKQLATSGIVELGAGLLFFVMATFYWAVDGYDVIVGTLGAISFLYIIFGVSHLSKSNKYPVIKRRKE